MQRSPSQRSPYPVSRAGIVPIRPWMVCWTVRRGAIVVMVGRLLGHEADMVEPAGDEQPREGTQEAETALALGLVQAGMTEAARRVPADGAALVLAIRDIERPVDQDREAQARPGAELEEANAALDTVPERHQTHARELRQTPRVPRHLASRHLPPIELDHADLLVGLGVTSLRPSVESRISSTRFQTHRLPRNHALRRRRFRTRMARTEARMAGAPIPRFGVTSITLAAEAASLSWTVHEPATAHAL